MDKKKSDQTYTHFFPLFLWLFVTVWLGMLGVFTHLYIKEGDLPGTGVWGPYLIAAFWFAGVGVAAYCFSQPIVRVVVQKQQIRVFEIYPFKVIRESLPLDAFTISDVKTRKDSDGDPYFEVTISFKDKELPLFGGHFKDDIMKLRMEFLEALEK